MAIFCDSLLWVDRVEGGGRISGKQFAVVSGVDVGACVGGSVSGYPGPGNEHISYLGKRKIVF